MSDLIERLEAFQEKSEIYAGCDENDEIWQDCGKYVLENLPAFLTALEDQKTVRGIEEITQGLWPVEIWPPCDDRTKWIVQGRARYGEESTLAAAVEAAGKKGEG